MLGFVTPPDVSKSFTAPPIRGLNLILRVPQAYEPRAETRGTRRSSRDSLADMPDHGTALPDDDGRRPFRIVVDVLATAEQVQMLHGLIGEAVCGASGEHPGPCRIAWTMSGAGGDEGEYDGSYGLGATEAEFIREQLEPIPVWSKGDVDRSLGI